MKVRLIVQMSGDRNGQPWPPLGEVVDVPDEEGADLCAARVAEPVANTAKAETATAPDTTEKRSTSRRSKAE